MKKLNIIIALLLCSLCCLTVYAGVTPGSGISGMTTEAAQSVGNFFKEKIEDVKEFIEELKDADDDDDDDKTETVAPDQAASDESTSNVEKAQEEENKDNNSSNEEENTGLATLPNGTGYVGVYSYLNLRDGAWGNIIGELYNNEEVTITGRDGDWYQVTTSKGNGYCHARYIFDAPDKRYSGDDPSDSSGGCTSGVKTDVVLNVSGDSLQGKIISAAQSLVDNYPGRCSFPYAAGTEEGNLGCAQVATTALVAAGALPATASSGGLAYASLGCYPTLSMLEQAGWTAVQVPPYQAGDVIFWDTSSAGRITHVGIVMETGNSVMAMSNSSKERKPRLHSAEYCPVMKVMRQL